MSERSDIYAPFVFGRDRCMCRVLIFTSAATVAMTLLFEYALPSFRWYIWWLPVLGGIFFWIFDEGYAAHFA